MRRLARRGVTGHWRAELAQGLGVPMGFIVAPGGGVLVDALGVRRGSTSPACRDRERQSDYIRPGPIASIKDTYMVAAASGLRTLAEVDQPGVRVVGIADAATDTRPPAAR